MFRDIISKALDQQKIIKLCEETIGHKFEFINTRTIQVLESEQTYEYYECPNCGLGKFGKEVNKGD